MNGKKVKCIVSRYDPKILQPPFETIKIGEVEVMKPDEDHLGVGFATNLRKAVKSFGEMQFYTSTDVEGFEYEIVLFEE